MVVQVGFGLFPVFGTLAFQPGGFSPLGVGSWRIVCGALLLGAVAFVLHGRAAWPARRDLPVLLLAAMLGVAVNQGLFLIGLSRSTPLNAGIVMTLVPVFTFVIAALVRQEHFSASRALGVGIALAGTAPLILSEGLHGLGAHGLGNLLMVSNALSYSCYLVLTKRLTRHYPAVVITAWAYGFSLAAVPLYALGQRLIPEPGLGSAWWSLAYILVFPTVVCYLLNMFALSRLRASTVAVYVYLQPFVTGLVSWAVFGERPTATMLVSAAALFAGIRLVARQAPAVQALEPRR